MKLIDINIECERELNINAVKKYKECRVLFKECIEDTINDTCQYRVAFQLLDENNILHPVFLEDNRELSVIQLALEKAGIPIVDNTNIDKEKIPTENESLSVVDF